MAEIRVLRDKASLDWEYDADADVLYISVGKPRPAVGIDIGEGVVVRYDEQHQEVVGLTILGLRTRVQAQVEGPG